MISSEKLIQDKILDGKKVADSITKSVGDEISRLKDQVTLALILVGNNPASLVYVKNKKRACDDAGILVKEYLLPVNTTEKELIQILKDCNNDSTINGILVQMPLPSHINEDNIVNNIDPMKDVDGLNIINQGKLLNGLDTIVPATPKGVVTLLKRYFIDFTGKNIVVIGRSKLVGKPLALQLLNNNATVTICHSKTMNLKEITKRADIVVAAIGKPKFITADMIKKDAIVIDVGINRVQGKIVGDVDFENVKEVAAFITPVPKGIGPMTIASLLENILMCYKGQKRIN